MPRLISKGEAVRSGKKRIAVSTWQETQILVLIASLVLWHWCPSCKIWIKVEAEGGRVGKADEKKPKKPGFSFWRCPGNTHRIRDKAFYLARSQFTHLRTFLRPIPPL